MQITSTPRPATVLKIVYSPYQHIASSHKFDGTSTTYATTTNFYESIPLWLF